MAVPWADWFAPPTSISGFDSGAVGNIDEWPFSSSDNAAVTDGASGTSTLIMNFNLSAATGLKKSFVLWLGLLVDNAAGYTINTIRVKDGSTTLLTDSSPELGPLNITSVITTTQVLYFYKIDDSAWGTNPDIDDINVEIDVTNNHGSTNSLRVTGARLSKTPFTAAQEARLPSTLVGQSFRCYRTSDLYDLGGVDDETVTVWPDASGGGFHNLLWESSGTPANIHDDDGEYIDFPDGSGTALIGTFGSQVTGNHLSHVRARFDTGGGGGTESRTIYALPRSTSFPVQGAPGDKNIMALDDEGSGDQVVMMSGDGSGGAHLHGGTITLDTWYRITEWIQESGNEHMWLNDQASPIVDAASGSNNLISWGIGTREDFNSARHFEGRISEVWFVDVAGKTEAELDQARSEWTNGGTEQEGFRWRNDDGSETTATWKDAQDTDIEIAIDTPARLRVLVDTYLQDQPTAVATLQYKRSDEPDSEWRTI